MAGGFRVTEDGFNRVTESLDLRITEEFFPLYGTSSMSAVGEVFSVGGILLGMQANLVGSLAELAAQSFTAGAVSTLNASSSIVSYAEWFKNFNAALSGSGTVFGKAGYLLELSSSLTSDSQLGLQPDIIRHVDSSLSASSDSASIVSLTMPLNEDLSSQGVIESIPRVIADAHFNGQSNATADTQGYLIVKVSSSLAAEVTSTIYPQLIEAAITLQGGAGTVNAYGGFLANGEADLNTNGILNGTAQMILNAIVTHDVNRRVTEDGGIRITDSGDFRTLFGEMNLINSALTVSPTITPFTGSIHAQRNGQWGVVTPRVKRDGNWVIPKVYVKDNGTWKRVY